MALPSRYRWLWWTLLVLSPLAYLLGANYLARDPAVVYSIDRDQAIAIARRFALGKGFATEGWDAHVMGAGQSSLRSFYRRRESPIREQLEKLVPANTVKVLLRDNPEGGDLQELRHFEADLGPDGRILGYEIRPARSDERPDGGEAPSRQLAEAALRQRAAAVPGIEFQEPSVESEKEDSTLVRTYTWKGASPQAPEATLTFRMQVRQGMLTSETVQAEIDDDAAGLGNPGQFILGGLVGLSWLALGLFGLVRYVRRMRQKEISHRRTLLIGAILGGIYVLLFSMIGLDIIGIQQKDAPWWVYWLALGAGAFGNVITAMLAGLAWGSGEGDVRESFPGKLTSLDALMTGRIFSRNVSQAIVGGTALGGWLVLAGGALSLAGGGGVATASLSRVSFIPLPGIYLLLAPLEQTVPFAIFGLLLPAAFAYRTFSRPRWKRLSLFAASAAACCLAGVTSEALWVGLLLSALVSLSLIALFFAFDFLTAAAALNAYWIATYLVLFPLKFEVGWKALIIAAAVAVPVLLLQAYFAFRGRLYREEEVRPLYAHHLAHRQELEAEVSAARQAQLQLGPQQIPSLPGLTAAAACRPARVVGGDFYDFFPMGRRQLGILLAEGGGEGLSAALAVAYAKGLLMPMAPTAAPLEAMARLRQALEPILAHTTRLGLLYARIDLQAGSLDYAQLGDYPRLLIGRDEGGLLPQAERAADRGGLSGASCPIRPGDRILLFTDGIAQTISALNEEMPEQWLQRFLASRREGSAQDILKAFLTSLKPRIKRAKRLGMDDDLSSVILHLSPDAQLGILDDYEDEVA